MTPSELFKAGHLKQAIEAQIQEVKNKPADPSRRLFLFELASFAGDLERAKRQIEAVNYGDPPQDAGVARYRMLLDAEEKRRRLFRDGLSPKFLVDPPEHATLRLEALNRLREGRQGEALELLDRANAGAGAIKGTLNGKPFEGLRDGDDLFGLVLEVFANGEYFWVPYEQIAALGTNAPATPRDLLWLPARLTMSEGREGEVFLPALYPGTHEHPDDAMKLGRTTDWKQAEGTPVLGVGLRTVLVGDDATSVLDWRELVLS